jgi:D-glycero-D-manno-heptose 1,7-bisphosphate phosphatase
VRRGWVETPEGGPLAFEPDRLVDDRRVGAHACRPAVFLDRDGVLNELARDPVSGDPESPLAVDGVQLIAGAAAAARELARAGFVLVCISNQPAAAKGKTTVERLQTVHERVLDLLARQQVALDASRLCLHHPDGVAPALSGRCRCRKPRPGMLLDAAAGLGLDLGASWMVGDTDADVAAGHGAGCRTILLEYPGSAHKRSRGARCELHATDLAHAVAPLLRERTRAATVTPALGDAL